jgi:TolC family type I secretion outer membrane protein
MICAGLFSGCRTTTAPDSPDREWVPPEWNNPDSSQDNTWKKLRAKKINSTKQLSLNELISIALENNPSTREAWQEAKQAEARSRQAKSALLPSVRGTAMVQRHKKKARPRTDELNDRSAQMGLEAKMLILDFGGRTSSIRAMNYALIAANYKFNKALQDLILDVKISYHSYYSAKSGLDAAEDDVRDAKATLMASEQKFKAGIVSKLDVLQAESNYADSLFKLEEAKDTLETEKADLAGVLGLPADINIKVKAPPEKPSEIKKEDVTDLINLAIKKRPDILSLRASVRSREYLIRKALSDMFPSLSIGTDAGRYYQDVFGASKGYNKNYEYSGFISVEWDIFSGFNNYFKKTEAAAAADEEKEKLIKAELEASSDVWSRYFAYRTSIRKLDFSEAFFESARASYNLSLEGYRTGLKDILDLLQSQTQLSAARSKLIQARKDLFIALAELIHATGRIQVPEQNR